MDRDGLTLRRRVPPEREVEQSTYNFEHSDTEFLFTAFGAHEKQAKHLMEQQLALPAYEQMLKAAHTFNLLDARGAISVTERAAYIGRIRNLRAQRRAELLRSRERLGFPMAPREWVAADMQTEGGVNMTCKNLLVELFAEELPPKALKKLGEAFAAVLLEQLKAQGLARRRLAPHRVRLAAPPGRARHRTSRAGAPTSPCRRS